MRFYFLLILFLAGCNSISKNSKSNEIQPNLAYHYNAKDRKLKSVKVFQDISSNDFGLTIIKFAEHSEIDTVNMFFELPTGGDSNYLKIEGNDTTKISVIDKKRLFYDGVSYTIYKFYQDALNARDEEMLIYFVDKIGIMRIENFSWGNFTELVSDEKGNQDLFFAIKDQIIHKMETVIPMEILVN